MTRIVIVVLTISLGVPLDALGPSWGYAAVNVWVWLALLGVWIAADVRHRLEIVACLLIGAAGEIVLGWTWGLYAYRLDDLPAFVPAGHALVFSAAVASRRYVPDWLPRLVVGAFVPYVIFAAWSGLDTQAPLWLAVLLLLMASRRQRKLFSLLFLMALAVEAYGTALGGWSYHPREPLLGLSTTNPPVWIGSVYCLLAALAMGSASYLTRFSPGAVGIWSEQSREGWSVARHG